MVIRIAAAAISVVAAFPFLGSKLNFYFMPTPIAHAIVSIPLAKTIVRENNSKKILFWSVVCATIADIDLIGYFFGVPINYFLGHRGFTHSIIFAFFISLLVCLFFYQA